MNNNSLKQKAVSSIVWASIQKFSGMGIQFISGIVLARLLTPYDFGCIGMLLIFVVLSDAFIDAGFGSALIQKKQPSREDYSTIFWWNLGMAVIMYSILFVSAPAISRFYNIPLLCDVLRVQGVVLFINAFNLVQRNQLRKKLEFKILSIISLIAAIVSLCITIFLAYRGFGVWALVAQNLVSAGIPAIVFWFYVKWRPTCVFSMRSFKELFDFGLFIFLSRLINEIGSKVTSLLIGKIYNPTILGFYSKASSTEMLASTTVSSVMTQITYPLYAQVQEDKVALGSMIKRLTTTIAYVTFPLMFLFILIAKPVFVLLYSEKWLASVPYFQVLCLVGLANCLQSVNTLSIAAIGESRVMFRWTLIKRTIGSTFIIVGLFNWGMKGLLCGVVFYNWFCYFVNVGLVSKHIGYKWSRQLYDLLPQAIASVISAVFGYFFAALFDFSLYLDGIVKLVVCLTVYMAWSVVFKPEAFTYTLAIFPVKYKFWKKKS